MFRTVFYSDLVNMDLIPSISDIGIMQAPRVLNWICHLVLSPKIPNWTQKTFNYQGKCLEWINQEFYSLTDHDQQRVHELIKGTGCEKLLLRK